MNKTRAGRDLYIFEDIVELFEVRVFRKELSESALYIVLLEDVSMGEYAASATKHFTDLNSAIDYAVILIKEWRRK